MARGPTPGQPSAAGVQTEWGHSPMTAGIRCDLWGGRTGRPRTSPELEPRAAPPPPPAHSGRTPDGPVRSGGSARRSAGQQAGYPRRGVRGGGEPKQRLVDIDDSRMSNLGHMGPELLLNR